MRLLDCALLVLILAGAATAEPALKLLDVGTGTGDSPTGGSGTGGASARSPALARFLQLVRSGERALGPWMARRAVDRTDAGLRQALASFQQAIALRTRSGITRAEAGADLNLPDLDLALIHYYLGNRARAMQALALPLAQGVPAGADWATRDRILAQTRKAGHLRGRLTAPFLAAFAPVPQRSGYTCGPTAVYTQLAGMGLPASLARLEKLRDAHDGPLGRIAQDGVTAAHEAGAELDQAWTEQPTGRDPEIGFPSGFTCEGIRDVISRGYPVILAVRGYVKPETGGAAWTSGHYVLAIGVKAGADGRVTQVFTVDPDGGLYRKFARAELEAIWDANQRGAIVLTPKSPQRRFRARLGVSTMFDGEAASRRWVGEATRAD